MKPHDWVIECLDGGHLGAAEVWKCRACAACSSWRAETNSPPSRPFYPNGSGLDLTMDCEESQRFIAEAIRSGFRPDLKWNLAKKPARFFMDTEFLEAGPGAPIHLVSIGLVADDGREYYAECSDTDLTLANDWVKKNVIPHLKGKRFAKPRSQIRADIISFVGVEPAEFWAFFSAYDWVVFAQIFGTMMDLPKNFPMHCMDLKQWMTELGVTKRWLPQQEGTEHNALEDAHWNKTAFEYLEKLAERNLFAFPK